MIALKRAYEPASPNDGARLLVERLWPRGVKKADLPLAGWLKEVAPSSKLRQWFGHDPKRWAEFQIRYRAELRAHRQEWEPILRAAQHGNVTLIYSAHDTEHNAAVVLKAFLEAQKNRG